MQMLERRELAQTLGNLPVGYFEQVVFALNVPAGLLLGKSSPQLERTNALLTWAETVGPGLVTLQNMVDEVLGRDRPTLDIPCPYKGLSYFDCNDKDYKYFYGRETLVQKLLTRVAVEDCVVIVGASGSGKSSVLRAGLLQQLKNQTDYEVRLLIPGEHPLRSLALAFVDDHLERTERARQMHNIEELIQKGAAGFSQLMRTAIAPRVLLAIDQFEETFTLCHDEAERTAFLDILLTSLELATPKLCLVLAMRSDFMGKCFEHHDGKLALKMQHHLEAVLPMTIAEIQQVITQPARQAGVVLEPGLTEVLLQDLKSAPGGLPLLQYTLTELWQCQQEHQLKLSEYVRLGGLTGTLRQRADGVYDQLTSPQQKIAKHIFLSLTHLGEGAEDTRRRITQNSLSTAQYPARELAAVVKRLADANLIVTDQRDDLLDGDRTVTIDIAHEALIRGWPRLQHWLNENRDLLKKQRKIELAAEEWQQQPLDQQGDYLLQGQQLKDARAFLQAHGQDFPLSPIAEQFLAKSHAFRQRNSLKLGALVFAFPLTVMIYLGIQAAVFVQLRSHWQVVHNFESEGRYGDSDLLGQALGQINSKGRSLNQISLQGANLSTIALAEARLDNANLQSVNLSRAILYRALLRKINLDEAVLEAANLREANLGGATIRSATLSDADLIQAFLRNADLENADLRDAKLNQADLINAKLRQANLYGADLSEAQLNNANLVGANLSRANLSGTNLTGANLRDADLEDTILSDVRLCQTKLPENLGLSPNRDCTPQDFEDISAPQNYPVPDVPTIGNSRSQDYPVPDVIGLPSHRSKGAR